MKSRFSLKTAPLCAVIVLSSGCGGPIPLSSYATAKPEAAAPIAIGSHALRGQPGREAALPKDRHTDYGASWMAPDAAGQDLLYVSNLSRVNVYTYPGGKFEGTLHGFVQASGECVDQKGDVFITDYGRGKTFEYAHGGSKPIRTLLIGGVGCAVDQASGDLAVTDGGVAIYKEAHGNPTHYKNPAFQTYFYCGYDDRGNLFVQGNGAPGSGHVVLGELAKGGRKLNVITINQSLDWPGGVLWDGKYLAVGDQTTSLIYRFSIGGSQGTEVGVVQLGSGAKYVRDFWIQGYTLIAPSAPGGRGNSAVLFYKYPTGGSAIKQIKKHVLFPVGTTVSKASA